MNNWKPIDTIPHDGTNVLTTDGKKYVVGNRPPMCGIGKWDADKAGNWRGSAFNTYYKPTHWMHLPSFPVMSHASVKKKSKCGCGNPKMGFNCMCEWVKNNPGDIEYSCEFCGLYSASRPRCSRCDTEEEEKPMKLKTIIVKVYDPKCKKAPYLFIELTRFTVSNFPKDETGVEQAMFLSKLMSDKGYSFRFYSSDESNEVEVVVHNYGSPGSDEYSIDNLKDSLK